MTPDPLAEPPADPPLPDLLAGIVNRNLRGYGSTPPETPHNPPPETPSDPPPERQIPSVTPLRTPLETATPVQGVGRDLSNPVTPPRTTRYTARRGTPAWTNSLVRANTEIRAMEHWLLVRQRQRAAEVFSAHAEHGASIGYLADLLGVSKGRAQKLVDQGRRDSEHDRHREGTA